MMNRKIIKSDDILILYVSFINSIGGKKRPVLVLGSDKTSLSFFSLTSRYENKSERIKKQYYKIKNWKTAGLVKQTYIDVGKVREIHLDTDVGFYRIGQLDLEDINGLNDFLEKFGYNNLK
ncbi:toxin-antitoxin system, toxin component, MazF family protein [Companilactobacillus sp. HBUAS59544]|uniref:toxin-antitoxin system, toxin component, MazF family protein n=1 Tax=Companilactobacillus sp. HBUAS59544 TaxID=3109363 RepID=UPI002FF24FDE